MRRALGKKLLSFVAMYAILIQSLSPFLALAPSQVFAQDATVTPTPTDTPTDTPTPTVDQTQVTATPTPTVDPSIITPTDTPTDTVTPTPTDTTIVEPTPTPNDPGSLTPAPVDNLSPPPADNSSANTSNLSNPSTNSGQADQTTPTPTPTQQENTGDEQLNLVILDNVSAPSIDLQAVADSGSAVLTTDKPDYAPTDTALITGSGLLPNTAYTLKVWSDDPPPTGVEAQVTSDENGVFAYAYQLDGTYRPNYKAELRDSTGTVIATVTFTDDTPIKITAKTHQGQEKTGGVLGGYTSGNVTTYSEGDSINFRFTLDANNTSNGQLQVRFTGNDSTCTFFDGTYVLGAINTISGATPVVSTSGSPVATDFGTSSGEWVQTLNISFSAAGEAVVNYTLTLSDEAGECNGSSQHSRLNAAGGDVTENGQQNVPVPANQVIEFPEITVTKNIDRDGNGSFEDIADAGEYCFSLDGGTCTPTDSSGQVIFTNTTPDGAHSITETQLDFSQGTYQFVSGSGTNCTFNGSTATATVASGTTSTDAYCTFNNALQTGSLTVIKHVVGGSDLASAWTMHVKNQTGQDVITPFAGAENPGVTNSFAPGTYNVSETGGPSGYTPSYTGCDSQGNINVTAGQTAICTLTNTRDAGTVTVNKVLVPSQDPGTFNLQINSTTYATGGNGTSTGAQIFDTGSVTVGETGANGTNLSDYTTSISCQNAAGAPVNSPTFTLNKDDNITCTITNTRKPKLTVHKVVINHGGNKTTADFAPYNVDGSPVTLDQANFYSIGSHTVTETPDANYTATFSDACDSNGNVTLTAGDDKTCTITNEEKPAKIIVNKVVVNDNGGTKVVSDFPLFVGQTGVTSGATNTFDSGSYIVSETNQTGYTGTISGECDANGNVTLVAGQTKTCTITNDDNAPALHLRKTVTNDNGGSALTTAWTLTATGTGGSPTNLSGTTPVDSGPTFKADNYALAEINGPSGYTAGAWNCGGATMPDATHVTVPLGGNVTCTINNDDQAGTLIVKKVVINDNGGNENANDFTFSVNGGAPVTFIESSDSYHGENDLTVNAGTYNITEPPFDGYNTTYDNCSDVVIPNGGTATCTITNNDVAPSLTLIKQIDNSNGGTATVGQWTLTAIGANGSPTNLSGTTPVNSGSNFKADTYTLDELGPSGYTASSWSCVKNNGAPVTGSSIALALGDSARCTITNSDVAPQLTVIKHVIGGTSVAGDFTMNVTGANVSDNSFPGNESGTTITLDAGSYSVDEDSFSGYTKSLGTNCSGTIANGETKTCTITNTRDNGTIQVAKIVDPHDDGASQWDISIEGPTNNNQVIGDGKETSVFTSNTGDYTITETGHEGTNANDYNSTYSCNNDQTGEGTSISLSLSKEQNVVCTFTNTLKRGSITVEKFTDPSDTGQSFGFVLGGDTSDSTDLEDGDSSTFNDLLPGSYTLSENPTTGWDLTNANCSSNQDRSLSYDGNENTAIILHPGEEITCSFTNTQRGSITGTKWNDLNGNGGRDCLEFGIESQFCEIFSDPTLSGWTIFIDKNEDRQLDEGEQFTTTGSDGSYSLDNLVPGTYQVCEVIPSGWNQTYPINDTDEYCHQVTVNPGVTEEGIDFGNHQNKLTIYKYNEHEDLLGGATFEICGEESEDCFSVTDNGEGDSNSTPGIVEVKGLANDYYTVTETEAPAGYLVDGENSCDKSINSEEPDQSCSFFNRPSTPILTIAKTNDKFGVDLAPGSSVLYKITVHADSEGGPADNVTVTDLLPRGFHYRSGSWTAVSTGTGARGDLKVLGVTTEPTYASPGTWQLGNMTPGETVTLTYLADIDGSQQSGIYKDVAWAQGKPSIGDSVLATSLATDFPIVDTNFVGTDVKVVNNFQAGVDYKATSTQEVLGASTYLPATGEPTVWVIIATLLGGLGFGTLILGLRLRKKYVE